MLRFLFILFLFFLSPLQASDNYNETGIPFIKNFSSEEYNAHGQNWAIVQDNNGFMYFGNTDGCVLQYDGVSWRQIPIPNSSIVRSLAMDSAGTIYAGAQNEVGYLAPDSIGQYQYISLLAEIDSAYQNFSNVWQIHATPEYLYFSTQKYLFRRDSAGNYKIWKAKTKFHSSFFIKGFGIFIHQMGQGLMKVDGDSLNLIPNGEKFNADWIYVLLPFDKTRLLIGTRKSGLFLYDGKSVVKFKTDAHNWFIENQIYHGVNLSDNTYVFATIRGGIIHFNSEGQVLKIIDKSVGLQDNHVWFSFQDKTGSIWLGLNKGISRVQYPSAFSLYNESLGLEGNVQAMVRHKDKIYAATGLGLFVLEKSSGEFTHSKFNLVPGIKSQCWALLPIENQLLVSSNLGIHKIINKKISLITRKSGWKCIRSIIDSNRVYIGLDNGVSSIYKTKQGWVDEGQIADIKTDARTIAEDSLGQLWIGTVYDGILRIELPKAKNENPVVEHYYTKNGLPSNNYNLVFQREHDIFYGTTHAIYRFDSKKNHFFPLQLSGDLSDLLQDQSSYTVLAIDKSRNIWFNNGQKPAVALKNGSDYYFQYKQFLDMPNSSIFSFLPETNGIVWFGGTKGIIRYDSNVKPDTQQDFNTHLRRVLVNGDSSIFGGIKQANSKNVVLPYVSNAIRFEYAATFFTSVQKNSYQYFLDGFDETWSNLTAETIKDYTNIPEGNYIFRVRAKNIFENISNEASFQFEILPPWYRTWWAYFFLLSFLTFISIFSVQQIIGYTKRKALAELIKNEKIEKMAEEKMRSKVAADFHDELGNRITKISLFSEILKSDINKTSKKTMEYLNKINDNANNLYNETRDFIWHLDPKKDTLHDLVIRLKIFGDELFDGTNIDFECNTIAESMKKIHLLMDWRQHILRIFKEAMHNALKYADCKNVKLVISTTNKNAILELTDNGRGFNHSEKFEGEGLKNMKNRTDAIDGKLMINSESGKGTIIKLSFNLPY